MIATAKNKLTMVIIAVMMATGVALAFQATTSAQLGEKIREGACSVLSDDGATCLDDDDTNTGTTEDITELSKQIVNWLSLIIGIVAVVMIIIGGLRYITSGGDQQKVTNAKNTIMYAIIGLVIILFAQTIVRLVVNNIGTTT